MCEEVRGEFGSVDEITHARVSALPYMNAAIQESISIKDIGLIQTLRMRPPVPCGLQRIGPKGGASINGQYIPENV